MKPEQIRAANALDYAQADALIPGARAVKLSNFCPDYVGCSPQGAFAYAKGDGEGWYVCFNHLATHLAHQEIGVVHGQAGLELLQYLTQQADSSTLKHATDEALAWLSYARRFVKKSNRDGGTDDSD